MLKISNAATLGLHAMVLLANQKEKPCSAHEAAELFGVSKEHLSKVFQRLVHAGLVKSVYGPGGGFLLARDADRITLLQVYEVIEGPLEATDCLLGSRVCGGEHCILGGLVADMNKRVREYFSQTRLSDLAQEFTSILPQKGVKGARARTEAIA